MYNVVLIMGTRISSFVPSNLYLPNVEAERLKATESVRAILRGEQIFPKKNFFCSFGGGGVLCAKCKCGEALSKLLLSI